jgi:hypothetical protein
VTQKSNKKYRQPVKLIAAIIDVLIDTSVMVDLSCKILL